MRVLAIFVFLSTISYATVAPNFQGDALGGSRIALRETLRPDRALLVCFWASWCVPCLEELKKVTDTLRAEPTLPIDLITVNVDTSETSTDVKPTLKLYNLTMPVILDPKHDIFAKYHEDKTLPFSVLIAPSGNIESTFNGFNEEMFTQIKQSISKMALNKNVTGP